MKKTTLSFKNNFSKTTIKLFAVFFFCFTFVSLSAQWTATTFPETEMPYSITKSPNGNLLVASYPGSGGYIFLSQDQGETWEIADVEGAVYPSNLTVGNTMFFGGRGSKIARTEDDGITWELFDFNEIYNDVAADIYALAYHNEKLFAAVFGHGICFSEDFGETWKETDRESLMVSYELDGRNTYTMESFNGKLFAIGANGIWTLNDDEMTWTLQREVWFAGNSLIFNNKLYISYVIQNGENGIEFTEDGETWQEIPNNADLPSFDIRGFQTDGLNIFVGTTEKGVFYTPDEGTTWIETEDWPPYFEVPGVVVFLSIPMDFCFIDGMVFAASYEKGIFKMEHPNPPMPVLEVNNPDINCSIFPNPAYQNATLSFHLENSANVDFLMYDMLGREILQYHFGHLSSGVFQKELNIKYLKSGNYIYVLRVNNCGFSGKILVK